MSNKIWQIAAGEPGRYFSKIFFDHDIILLGPGDYGDIKKMLNEYQSKGLSVQKVNEIKRFADSEVLVEGDIILLRETYKVVGIGVVGNSEYIWDENYDDIYGWDLQHCRRVIWQDHLLNDLIEIQKKEELFSGRKQIHMFTEVADSKVINRVKHLFPMLKKRKLKDRIHNVEKPLSLKELSEALYVEGLAIEKCRSFIDVIEEQRRLLSWYKLNGYESKRPTEHEIVGFMALPLFLSLGWSKQLLSLEWHKIDLAGFESVPSTTSSCVFICEAKALNSGMQKVFDQADLYRSKHNIDNCRKIVTTDGRCIYIYEKNSDGIWGEHPVGYINIMKIRKNHLVPVKTNAVKSLMSLTPEGIYKKLA